MNLSFQKIPFLVPFFYLLLMLVDILPPLFDRQLFLLPPLYR